MYEVTTPPLFWYQISPRDGGEVFETVITLKITLQFLIRHPMDDKN